MLNHNDKLQNITPNKVSLIQQNDGECYLKQYSTINYPNILEVLLTIQGKQFTNIVKINKVEINEDSTTISVFEEACLDDLRMIVKINRQIMDIQEILKCLLDVINGLLELKSYNIFHRDIKPDNVVYDGSNFKIIDFETAKVFQDDTKKFQSLQLGTIGYRAPEIIKKTSYSSKCDIWSLGCLFYFLLFKKDIEESAEVSIPLKHNFNSEIINLLRKMLEVDETKRINLENLQEEALKLYKVYNNSSQSTDIEIQNETFDDRQQFNQVMMDLIKNEKDNQTIVYLYQFWANRIEIKYPSDTDLRIQIQYDLLKKIKEFKERNIKTDQFVPINVIKESLRTKIKTEFYDI